MKRFACILAAVVGFLAASMSLRAQENGKEALAQTLKHLAEGHEATVGIAVILNGNELVAVNDRYHYPLMSTFKFHQALAVLDHLNRHGETLDTEILVRREDLPPGTYSPLRDAHPDGNFTMTVRDLLRYSVTRSDNNACDILFRHIGGPKAADRYLRRLGIRDFSISATEADMHETVENQYLNWTTPSAAALTLETFLQRRLFPEAQRRFLQQALVECATGADKLRAGLPREGILLGHKTGSSDRTQFGIKIGDNDMGFVVLPSGRYYTLAVFIMNSRETDAANAALIRDISKAVYDYCLSVSYR